MSAVASPTKIENTARARSSFWVVTYPACETVLFVVPTLQALSDPATTERNTTIDVYDSDGDLVNEVLVRFPATELGMIEMSPFLGGCKLDSGFKHGRIAVRSDFPCQHLVRIQSRDSAVMAGDLMSLDAQHPLAMPFIADQKRSSMLVLVNEGSAETEVRVKLYLSTRSPEIRQRIPPGGSRLVLLERAFSDCLEGESAKLGRGYIKLTTTLNAGSAERDSRIGVQLVERILRTPENEALRMVC